MGFQGDSFGLIFNHVQQYVYRLPSDFVKRLLYTRYRRLYVIQNSTVVVESQASNIIRDFDPKLLKALKTPIRVLAV